MFNIPETYQLIKSFDLDEIASKGYLIKHKKSGARLSLVSNDDKNKVFFIGFRTTPTDSTGVAHILEHSVLCGSKKYPLKDPFIELAKGSLNTFLNAMTYPDKTVYPIASENDKDFKNLTDVYMDAVLSPNIYENEKIFLQEGWHYEMKEESDPLTINGVVYNEMKGAFSSPEDVLERECLNSLFPDNTYAFESGGDPDNIPDLTYENFLNFHKRYYHPSNSYIYIYGDCDMEERLLYLDREYLSKYDSIDPDSEIAFQKPFSEPVDRTREYPVAEGGEDETYFQKNYCVGSILDPKLYQAFQALDYALLSSPGAPLRKALMAEGLGLDVTGGYSNGTLQTYFSVGVKGAKLTDKEKFLATVDRVLKEQVAEGVDKQALLAAINIQDFSYREADFGPYPKGLVYGLIVMDSWLYDEGEPFVHFNTIKVLKELKKDVETGYFEELIEKYLLNNNHRSMVTLVPKEGLSGEKTKALEESLEKRRKALSHREISGIINTCRDLEEYQSQGSTPEEIDMLPTLTRKDLDRSVKPLKNRLETVDGTQVIYHDLESNGINYLNLMFKIGDIPEERLKTLSLMMRMMGLLDTKKHSYTEFSNLSNILTGGLYSSLQIFPLPNGDVDLYASVNVKFLEQYTEDAMELAVEMIEDTLWEDSDRMQEILNQEIAHFKMRLMSSGHVLSAGRAQSRFSKESYISQITSGIEFYEYMQDFASDFKKNVEAFKAECKKLIPQVFRRDGLFISSTGKRELTAKIEPFVPKIRKLLSDLPLGEPCEYNTLHTGNEGFKTAAAIQYVSRAGNFKKKGLPYRSTLRILKTILSYEYFWNNVRVKGGAYGCMAGFKRSGDLYFVSYRDPNLEKTNETFEKTTEFVKDFDVSDKDMTRYVIGTISSMDTPLTPSSDGDRSLSCYLLGLTEQQLLEERAQVLDADCGDIRELSDHIKAAMDENYLCVIGNDGNIEAAEELFDSVRVLA